MTSSVTKNTAFTDDWWMSFIEDHESSQKGRTGDDLEARVSRSFDEGIAHRPTLPAAYGDSQQLPELPETLQMDAFGLRESEEPVPVNHDNEPVISSLNQQRENIALHGIALPSQTTPSAPLTELSLNAPHDPTPLNAHEEKVSGSAVYLAPSLQSAPASDLLISLEDPPMPRPFALTPLPNTSAGDLPASRQGRKRKYSAHHGEYNAAYYQANKEKITAYRQANKEKITAYRQAHKNEIAAKKAAYGQAHKNEIATQKAAYRQAHKTKLDAKNAAYRQAHKNEIAAQKAAYRATRKTEFSAYTQAHKEKIAAHKAAYRQAHKEKIATHQAAYRQAHKEKIATHQAAYRQAQKEKIAAHKAAYRQAHKEEINARRKKQRNLSRKDISEMLGARLESRS